MWLKYCINNLKWQSIGIGKVFRIGTSLIPNSIRKLYFFPQKRSFFVIPKLFRGVVSHVPKEVHLFRGWVKFIGSNKYSKQIVIKLLSIHFSKWILFYFRLQLKKKNKALSKNLTRIIILTFLLLGLQFQWQFLNVYINS